MGKFYWNEDLENKLKEIYFLYTNKEISIYFDEFKGLSPRQINRKGNEDLKLNKSDFILKNQRNKNIPIDFEKRVELYNLYSNVKDGYKMCMCCHRVLENISDYFFYKKGELIGVCKECSGYEFTDKLIKIPKEGYKYCIKCDRELPNTSMYYPIDRTYKDDLRNVCRECGKDGHFMDEGYIGKRVWTDEENEIFKDRYPNYTGEELINLFYTEETNKTLELRAYRLGISFKTEETTKRANKQKAPKLSEKLKGMKKSSETRVKISKIKKEQYANGILVSHWKGRIVSEEERERIRERVKGKWDGDKNPRHLNPLNGELNGNWKGGIKPIYFYLRDFIKDWKQKSMESTHFRCGITGYWFKEIHHLYPFRDIVDEVFINLEIDVRTSLGDYSKDELKLINEEIIRLHEFYGLGIPLSKEIHKLFHDMYGYTKVDKQMFYEFREDYYNGKYDDLLPVKLKSNNSIERLKELGVAI